VGTIGSDFQARDTIKPGFGKTSFYYFRTNFVIGDGNKFEIELESRLNHGFIIIFTI